MKPLNKVKTVRPRVRLAFVVELRKSRDRGPIPTVEEMIDDVLFEYCERRKSDRTMVGKQVKNG